MSSRRGSCKICCRGPALEMMRTGDFFQVFGQFGIVREVDSYRDAVFVVFDSSISSDKAKAASPFRWNSRPLLVSFASSRRYQPRKDLKDTPRSSKRKFYPEEERKSSHHSTHRPPKHEHSTSKHREGAYSASS